MACVYQGVPSLLFCYVRETTVYVNGDAAEKLATSEIGASRYTLAGQPTDLRELLTQGHRSGARIHVLAWGSAAVGTYDNDSYEADLYLSERSDDVRTTHHEGRHPAIRAGCSPGWHRTG